MTSRKSTAPKHANNRRRRLNALLIALMVLGALAFGVFSLGGGATSAYAARVGHKNEQACDACEAVRDGETPSLADYSSNAAHTHAQADQRSGLTYGTDGYSTSPVTYEEVFPGGSTAAATPSRASSRGEIILTKIPTTSPACFPTATPTSMSTS